MFFYSKKILFENSGPIFAVEHRMFTACLLQLYRTTGGTPIHKVLHTLTSAVGQTDHREYDDSQKYGLCNVVRLILMSQNNL